MGVLERVSLCTRGVVSWCTRHSVGIASDPTGGGALDHVDNRGAGEGSTMFVVGCRGMEKDGSGANNIRRKHDDDVAIAAITTIPARAASANSATRYDDNTIRRQREASRRDENDDNEEQGERRESGSDDGKRRTWNGWEPR